MITNLQFDEHGEAELVADIAEGRMAIGVIRWLAEISGRINRRWFAGCAPHSLMVCGFSFVNSVLTVRIKRAPNGESDFIRQIAIAHNLPYWVVLEKIYGGLNFTEALGRFDFKQAAAMAHT